MNLPDPAVRRVIENALSLQRVHNAIDRDASGVIRALFDELAAEIARADPTAVRAMRYRRDRVDKLLARVEALTGEAFDDWHRQVRQDLARLGRQQGQEATHLLRITLADAADLVRAVTPTQNQFKAILDVNPFRGETLRGWADVQQEGVVRRVRQQIQIGMIEEESIDAILRRIRGKSDGRGGYVGGVLGTATDDARALVRTAVTEVANEAALMTYRENRRLAPRVQFVATLDRRTCKKCMPLDGRIWESDDPGLRRPPIHWQCRCMLVPVIDWVGLGIDPPEEGERAARDPGTGRRTQVAASTDYEGWLRQQSAGEIDEILGPRRGRLFREGKIRLDDLIGRDGRILTLDELEGRLAA